MSLKNLHYKDTGVMGRHWHYKLIVSLKIYKSFHYKDIQIMDRRWLYKLIVSLK